MKVEAMDMLDKLRGRKDALPAVLVAASAILVVLALWKVGGFFSTSSWAMKLASKAALVGMSGGGDTAKHLEKSKNTADALKKKNLFAPPAAKQHPVKAVPGILGNSAFINGKWLAEGQNMGDAKVVAVEPTQVKIEWDGNEKSFLPIMADASGAPGSSGRPSSRPSSSSSPGERGPVAVNVQGRPGGPGGFRGPGGMDPQAMRERFMNMSEQERQAFRDRMRAQFGGGGPGGFRGPGGGRPDFGGRGGGDFGGRGGSSGGRGPR